MGIEKADWYKRAERRAKYDPYGTYPKCLYWLLDKAIEENKHE